MFVKHQFRLGRDKYQTLTGFYDQTVMVKHPSPAVVTARENELLPILHEVECGGIWASIPELVQKSLQETLTHLVTPEKLEKIGPNDTIKGHYVCGADASGNNPIYR